MPISDALQNELVSASRDAFSIELQAYALVSSTSPDSQRNLSLADFLLSHRAYLAKGGLNDPSKQVDVRELWELIQGKSTTTFIESHRHRTPTGETTPKHQDQKEIDRLREEVRRLTNQIELLQTRVAEQRRSLARESRQSDKFQTQLESISQQNSLLIERQDDYMRLLSERGLANDSLVAKMAAVENGLLRMHEAYEGQVQHVGENAVVVVYNVDGRLVEQTYEKKQFKDGKMPSPGACVKVLVFVVEYEPKPPSDAEPESATSDEPTQRKPLTGPVEF